MFYISNPSLSFEDNLSFEKSYLHSASSSYSGPSFTSSSSSTNASFSPSSQSSYPSTSSKTESVNHDLSSSITSSDTRPQSDSHYIAALKEWAIVCKAIENGKQVLLFHLSTVWGAYHLGNTLLSGGISCGWWSFCADKNT